jgi:hypothetical protein
MEGSVKITVIATGFDRAMAALAPASQANVVTPTDLNAYTVRPQEDRFGVNGGVSGRISIARRPSVELPPLGSVPTTEDPGGDAESGAGEEPSPLDVPAFLRRQEG